MTSLKLCGIQDTAVCVSSLFDHSIQVDLRRKTLSNGQHGENWTVTIFKMQCRIQIGHKRIYKRTSCKKRANIQKDM